MNLGKFDEPGVRISRPDSTMRDVVAIWCQTRSVPIGVLRVATGMYLGATSVAQVYEGESGKQYGGNADDRWACRSVKDIGGTQASHR